MYLPQTFANHDPEQIAAVLRDHSFATLITPAAQEPGISHLPLLHRPGPGPHGVLLGHLARANPQWRQLVPDRDVLAVFLGPHGYISPRWYVTPGNVPTWNYVVVHVHGRPRVIDDETEAVGVLRTLTDHYESGSPGAWSLDQLDPAHLAALTRGIVAFEIAITRIEAKFKLGQNRRPEDAAGGIAALAGSATPEDRELARWMQRHAPGA